MPNVSVNGEFIMNEIAEFKKVSFYQFKKDIQQAFPSDPYLNDESQLRKIYDDIILPTRSSSGSAGYDVRSPINVGIGAGETVIIPTGLRCKINDGWFLMMVPRSGLGFKFRLQLDNTVGVIDSDYYNADNEGHIMAKITNDSHEHKMLNIYKGDRFIQGIFVPFGVVLDDNAKGVRTGGFGSSGMN